MRQINYETLVHLDNAGLLQAMQTGNWRGALQKMGNVLEPVTEQQYPEIGRLKAKMLKLGADVAQMSGTGPTVFAICRSESRAKRVYNGLRGFCHEVYQVVML